MPIDHEALKNSNKSSELPKLNRPNHPSTQPEVPTDRASRSSEQAKALTGEAVTLLSRHGSDSLKNLAGLVTRVQDRREATVEQVSDLLALLYDPNALEADITRRTLDKLGIGQEVSSQLEELVNPYEGFEITYPVLPTSVAGMLPSH